MTRALTGLAAALALGVLAACGTSSPPADDGFAASAVDGFDQEWPQVPTMGAGTAAYAAGSWAYEDYVYDSTAGSSKNSGDLAVLQIALSGDAVRHVARLNSYVAGDPTLIALAVDTDCNDATGGGAWPNGSGVSTAGWEFVVQAGDAGASVFMPDAAPIPIPSAASHDRNVIEFDVPFSVASPGKRWCYRGLVGLGGDRWTQTTNVLFRNRTFDQGTETTDENDSADTFQTGKQAAALQSGDFSDFRREVDFDLIASGASLVPEPPAGNLWFTRIVEAPDFPNALPEGVHPGENALFSPPLYNGRFQPYSIYVPQSYRDDPRPAPMLPMLHGIVSNHRNNGWPLDDGPFWSEVVHPNRMILAMPLARGEETWYEHVAEVDVLAVIEDVRKHYNIDADKQFLGGASMGGLGALKIAESHPDLFAGLILSVPPMSDRLQGYVAPELNDYDLVELAGSLRHVPVLTFSGALDPIVPPLVNSARFCNEMSALGLEHDCWLDLAGSHYSFYNPRFAEIKNLIETHRRVRDPARVTFRLHPAFRRHAQTAGVGHLLPYRNAYWVRDIVYPALPDAGDCPIPLPNNYNPCEFPIAPGVLQRLIDGATISRIDVRSYGKGEGDPLATAIGDDPDPVLVRTGTTLAAGAPVEAANRFDLHAENVLAFDLDLDRMGLRLNDTLVATVSGAGTLRLGLLGGNGQSCSGTLDGAPLDLVRQDGRVEVELDFQQAAGSRALSVSCSN